MADTGDGSGVGKEFSVRGNCDPHRLAGTAGYSLSQTEEANDFTNMKINQVRRGDRIQIITKAVLEKIHGDETISAEVESDVTLRSRSIKAQHTEYGGLSSRLQQLQDLEMQKPKLSLDRASRCTNWTVAQQGQSIDPVKGGGNKLRPAPSSRHVDLFPSSSNT
jgi:hypothetical protein